MQKIIYDPFDLKKLETKKKQSTALIISDVVLVASSPVALCSGAVIFGNNGPSSEFSANLGLTLVVFSFIEAAVGLPVLIAGIVIRHQYVRLSKEMNLQTGILPNGQLGLAVNF